MDREQIVYNYSWFTCAGNCALH
uniref:Uncharacterized protein n=1 Tax=Arundo donax TaxID=35708 RepID=A0A0A9HHQ4_ARUDO